MRAGKSLSVSSADIRRLKAVVQDRNAPQKHVWRAEIVLLTADGVGTNEIMRRTAKSKTCVWRWQERFVEDGFDGLVRDKTRPSQIKPLSAEAAERVVALTLGDPPGETTHWTGALMARAAGLSVSSVQRIWRAHGLQPHRMRQFKLSNDPRFVDKLRDVVGLYVDPPAHAIVLSVDEKSQIQALDRTQPGLPPIKWRGTSRRPIPENWHFIGQRSSPYHLAGNRNAAHPVNAILNYAYVALESEIRIKAISDGYDPAIGIMHEGGDRSSKFIFDLMEPERPKVDRKVFDFIKGHVFDPADFVIRSDGVCRLNPEMARMVVVKAFAQRSSMATSPSRRERT